MKYKFVSVDFQNDFTSPGGKSYKDRPSVGFVKDTLVPFLCERKQKVAEIISDYRQPRIGDRGDLCHPGEWGYESQIPIDIKEDRVWVKCMNSPVWTREHIGDPEGIPGLPFQDPAAFDDWISSTVGKYDELDLVILIGLTVDCCVFCTAQELGFRGFKVVVLEEAVDTNSNDPAEKDLVLHNRPLKNWAKPITWEELNKIIE